jgi:hypothetical protein
VEGEDPGPRRGERPERLESGRTARVPGEAQARSDGGHGLRGGRDLGVGDAEQRDLAAAGDGGQVLPAREDGIDARGTDRGGARKRFGDRMAKARERRPKPPGGAA